MDRTSYEYQIGDGDIVVLNRDKGNVHWRGRPKGYPAESVVPVPGDLDAVILVPRGEKEQGSFRNLLRIDANGSIVWEAELPDLGADAYAKVAVRDRRLVGWSWSGYMVGINWDTGKIEKQTFTK